MNEPTPYAQPRLTTADAIRPPMPYAGGKQKVADRIVDLLPPHQHYVEPFAGALSVLLAKTPSPMETVNDLNRDLVTFWQVLRDQSTALITACARTPHSRAELRTARHRPADLDDLERARRVWVQATQARAATLRTDKGLGWRFVHGGSAQLGLPAYLDSYLDRMVAAAARLRRVSLECGDAFDVIASYGRHPEVCLYVDPPYLGAVRGTDRLYVHELDSEADHTRLLAALSSCRAAVVLSGYAHPLYDEALAGWHRYELSTVAQTGAPRIEVVWANRAGQPSLFSGAAA